MFAEFGNGFVYDLGLCLWHKTRGRTRMIDSYSLIVKSYLVKVRGAAKLERA